MTTKPEPYSYILRRMKRAALQEAAKLAGATLPPIATLTRDELDIRLAGLGVDLAPITAAAKAEFAGAIAQMGTIAVNGPAPRASDIAEWAASTSEDPAILAEFHDTDPMPSDIDPATLPAAGDEPSEPDASVDIDAAANRDFAELAGLWANMDPVGFRARLRDMTVLANRPPVEVVREVQVEVVREVQVEVVREVQVEVVREPGAPRPARPTSRRTGQTTAAEAFGAVGRLGATILPLYDGSEAPAADPDYVWIEDTPALLSRLFTRRKPIWLAGPAGTGKTEWARQLAAKLGRPFARITCTATTEAASLLGMTVPAAGGGVVWQDGSLTAALRRPGCVILIDEPTVARSGSLYAFQSLLDGSRAVVIEETGEAVGIHEDAVFIFADNTNGSGDQSGQYVGTGPISAALVNRMGAMSCVDYLPAAAEAAVIVAKTGAPQPLAELLVAYARLTRTKCASGDMTAGLGLRALLSWAEQIVDGVPAHRAADLAFLNAASPDNVEQMRQLLATHCHEERVTKLAGTAKPADRTAPATPAPAPRRGVSTLI